MDLAAGKRRVDREADPVLEHEPVLAEPDRLRHAVLHTQRIQPRELRREPRDEPVPAPGLSRRPENLGERQHTGQDHVLRPRRRRDVLGPHVSLGADDVGGLLGRQARLGTGSNAYTLSSGTKAADGQRLGRGSPW